MKNTLLGGVAVTLALMIQSLPGSAQRFCPPNSPCNGQPWTQSQQQAHGGLKPPPAWAQSQQQAHAHWGQGSGVAAGAAALTAGALINGAFAAPRQEYYPAEVYPVYSDQRYEYNEGGNGGRGVCAKLQWACEHREELGLRGTGTCSRYRQTCD
jgi:hypothetical protein